MEGGLGQAPLTSPEFTVAHKKTTADQWAQCIVARTFATVDMVILQNVFDVIGMSREEEAIGG